jgi:SprT-like family
MHITISEGQGIDANTTHAPLATPTAEAYGELQDAYDYFNRELYDNQLPPCLITLQRRSKSTLGYFSHKQFRCLRDGRITTDEIALNPLHFDGRAVIDVLATLAHEMAHLWQAHFGKPSRSGYHNRQWAAKMASIGLMPSHTGQPGGRKTGQQMTHYPIAGGCFDKATAALLASGFRLSWADAAARPQAGDDATPVKSGIRVKYMCPSCAANAWGKSGLRLICGDCAASMQGQ